MSPSHADRSQAGRSRAAITGIGLLTPAGIGTKVCWDTVRNGTETMAAVDPLLWQVPAALSCRVPDFDGEALLDPVLARRTDRFSQFALVAAQEAVADAGLDPASWDGARVGVVLGNTTGGVETAEEQYAVLQAQGARFVSPLLLPKMLPNMVAGQLSAFVGATGPGMVVATACSSGATAIGVARDLLAADRYDVVLTGATDAIVTPAVVAGFARLGALSQRVDDPAGSSRPFDKGRDGFVCAEGAGVLVLEREADARARGVTPHAYVAGFGATSDAHHITRPHPDGHGTQAAIDAALRDADAVPADVGYVNAHGTSTLVNDRLEAALLARNLPHGPPVSSTKGVTGHLLGAAGAVEAAFTALALREQVVPPNVNLTDPEPTDLVLPTSPCHHSYDFALSLSAAFGGQNAVLAITSH
ncbi:beta-ketoacyl-[acyl-carrier-protein] synthase family protein [Actinomadura fulvescens]|uniref:Beta-ketoacyl-[acyl-carrier-protein] synthase family protein n=1 Tax=Actinomadura fulvescens TaxID=46160 RepID=A0ABP6D7K3_9ACTN